MVSHAKHEPGWAVLLKGQDSDLSDWRLMLPAPFDPYVANFNENGEYLYLLRYNKWNILENAHTVYQDADRLLVRLNGLLLAAFPDIRPVEMGTLWRFKSDGVRENTVFIRPSVFVLSGGSIRIKATARGHVEREPEPTVVQNATLYAEQNDIYDDLFVHISRAQDWYELYKVCECATKISNKVGRLSSLLSRSEMKAWNTVRQTANHYRHARDSVRFAPPTDPPSLEEARLLVLQTVWKILESATDSRA